MIIWSFCTYYFVLYLLSKTLMDISGSIYQFWFLFFMCMEWKFICDFLACKLSFVIVIELSQQMCPFLYHRHERILRSMYLSASKDLWFPWHRHVQKMRYFILAFWPNTAFCQCLRFSYLLKVYCQSFLRHNTQVWWLYFFNHYTTL